MDNKKKARRIVIIMIVMIAVVAGLGAGLWIEEQSDEKNRQQGADTLAKAVGERYTQIVQNTEETGVWAAYLENPADETGETKAQAALKTVQSKTAGSLSVTLMNTSGQVLMSTDGGQTGKNAGNTNALKQLNTAGQVYSELSVEKGLPVMVVSRPLIQGNDTIVGVLEIKSDLSALKNQVADQLDSNMSFWIVDNNGKGLRLTAKAGWETALRDLSKDKEGPSALAVGLEQQTWQESQGILRYSMDGEQTKAAYKTIDGLGWAVVAGPR